MLTLYGQKFKSRFLLGTAGYPSLEILCQAINISQAEILTVSLKRQLHGTEQNNFWTTIKGLNKFILPNTAGCHYAKDAVTTAKMAREIFQTHWIKLEVIGDQYTLQPDPYELIHAAERLIKDGFNVLPYCSDDLIVCQHLLNAGCQVLMPWAAPIGSGQGIINPRQLALLRARFPSVPLIIDAGLGKPSHAAQAMELGYDAVLLNSAVAMAHDPVTMAQAFKNAIHAGHAAYTAGIMPESDYAVASTPVLDTPFWHQKNE